MNRRDFLLTGSATVVTPMLPLPANAVVQVFDYGVPVDQIEPINQAFNILEDYKFSLSEKAELFGLYSDGFKNLDDLRDYVFTYIIDEGCRDGWARTHFLIQIRQKLDERFGNDLDAQLAWMRKREAPFTKRSLREMMTTTYYMDVYYAVCLLGGSKPT